MTLSISGARAPTQPFRGAGMPDGLTLLDYWRWAYSDLIGNTDRGVLAEFIVGISIGAITKSRERWEPFDLRTADTQHDHTRDGEARKQGERKAGVLLNLVDPPRNDDDRRHDPLNDERCGGRDGPSGPTRERDRTAGLLRPHAGIGGRAGAGFSRYQARVVVQGDRNRHNRGVTAHAPLVGPAHRTRRR